LIGHRFHGDIKGIEDFVEPPPHFSVLIVLDVHVAENGIQERRVLLERRRVRLPQELRDAIAPKHHNQQDHIGCTDVHSVLGDDIGLGREDVCKHSHEEKEHINEPVHDLEVDESAQENVVHAWVGHQELRNTRRQHVVDESNEKNVAVGERVQSQVLNEQVLRPSLRRDDNILVELLRGHTDHIECGKKEEDNRHDRGIHENPDDDQHVLNEDTDRTVHEVVQAT